MCQGELGELGHGLRAEGKTLAELQRIEREIVAGMWDLRAAGLPVSVRDFLAVYKSLKSREATKAESLPPPPRPLVQLRSPRAMNRHERRRAKALRLQ
jgi:hypothetical protein